MAPAAQSAVKRNECFGGLAEQDDAEFEPYRAGISAEAVDAAYRLLAPSAKVGPPARSPMCMTLCITAPTALTLPTVPTLRTTLATCYT